MPRKTCSNLALGLVLQHEAHRDGIVGSASQQSAETLVATTAHTQMALNMASDSRYTQSIMSLVSSNQNLQNDLNAYIAAYQYGNSTIFSDYVAGNYDSSADYWLFKLDGSIEDTADKAMYKEYVDEMVKEYMKEVRHITHEIDVVKITKESVYEDIDIKIAHAGSDRQSSETHDVSTVREAVSTVREF